MKTLKKYESALERARYERKQASVADAIRPTFKTAERLRDADAALESCLKDRDDALRAALGGGE